MILKVVAILTKRSKASISKIVEAYWMKSKIIFQKSKRVKSDKDLDKDMLIEQERKFPYLWNVKAIECKD